MAVLSLAKQLGVLAVKTVANAIASGIKKDAGCPPKVRQFVINLGQVLSLSLSLSLSHSHLVFQIHFKF